jgi:phospho-N-acetylmuramoyl-pentapeptide-transferase
MAIATFQAVRILITAVSAFAAALFFTPLAVRLITRLQLNKQIRASADAPIFASLHKKKEGTPTAGGIIIWGAVLLIGIAFALNPYLNFIDRAQTYLPIASFLIAAAIGLVDDIFGILRIGPKGGGLAMRHKLLMYFLIAAVGAWWFYYRLEWDVLYVPFLEYVAMGWWYVPFFMFVIIASAFSVNETDGLDGLAGGVMLFAFSALTAIAFVLERYHLAAFNAAIVGALLAFLWFNIYPARFFMGDTGSMALGITMGVTAMLTNTALFLPLLAAIPVLESVSVVVQLTSKKIRGKKIFLSTPIHHHFEAIGWPESQITMRFWIISAVGSIAAIVFFFISRFL